MDDWVCSGHGKEFERALERLKKEFSWGAWEVDDFHHCGRHVSRDTDGSVLVEQLKYIEKIKPVVPTTRSLAVPITDPEMAACRSVLGNLGWAAKQTQPQGTYDVSRLLGELPKRSRGTITKINKSLKRIQEEPVTLRQFIFCSGEF